jgi:Na+/H+-dicarboxylate symporter
VSFGLILVNTIQPGNTFPEEKKIELQEKFNSTVDLKKDQAAKVKEETPLQFFVDMVPSNFFMAASDNTKMLQIIFFAILFGIAMVLLEEKQIVVVRDFFNGIDAIILKIIDLIMAFRFLGRCGFVCCFGFVCPYGDSGFTGDDLHHLSSFFAPVYTYFLP